MESLSSPFISTLFRTPRHLPLSTQFIKSWRRLRSSSVFQIIHSSYPSPLKVMQSKRQPMHVRFFWSYLCLIAYRKLQIVVGFSLNISAIALVLRICSSRMYWTKLIPPMLKFWITSSEGSVKKHLREKALLRPFRPTPFWFVLGIYLVERGADVLIDPSALRQLCDDPLSSNCRSF